MKNEPARGALVVHLERSSARGSGNHQMKDPVAEEFSDVDVLAVSVDDDRLVM